jgi:hypothetical protein
VAPDQQVPLARLGEDTPERPRRRRAVGAEDDERRRREAEAVDAVARQHDRR